MYKQNKCTNKIDGQTKYMYSKMNVKQNKYKQNICTNKINVQTK